MSLCRTLPFTLKALRAGSGRCCVQPHTLSHALRHHPPAPPHSSLVRALSSAASVGPGWGSPTADNDRYEFLHVTFKDGVRTIMFNRADKKNALTEQMFDDVAASLDEAAKDPDTVITAITGAGNVFCAGNDLKNFHTCTMQHAADLLIRHMGAFVDFPKPLVAVVNGAAVGVGTTLLPLYDLVYASDKAVFFTPFSALNITVEGCSSFTFPHFLGQARAGEILLFGKKVSAKEAHELHLITEVFEASKLYEEVWPRLEDMAKLPVKSLVYSKALTRDLYRDTLHKVNSVECKRVIELLMGPRVTKEEFDKYMAENF